MVEKHFEHVQDDQRVCFHKFAQLLVHFIRIEKDKSFYTESENGMLNKCRSANLIQLTDPGWTGFNVGRVSGSGNIL